MMRNLRRHLPIESSLCLPHIPPMDPLSPPTLLSLSISLSSSNGSSLYLPLSSISPLNGSGPFPLPIFAAASSRRRSRAPPPRWKPAERRLSADLGRRRISGHRRCLPPHAGGLSLRHAAPRRWPPLTPTAAHCRSMPPEPSRAQHRDEGPTMETRAPSPPLDLLPPLPWRQVGAAAAARVVVGFLRTCGRAVSFFCCQKPISGVHVCDHH